MSSGVGCRLCLDPELLWLWLWCRPAATVPIGPLALEPPYVAGVALEQTKKTTTTKKKQQKTKTKPTPGQQTVKGSSECAK